MVWYSNENSSIPGNNRSSNTLHCMPLMPYKCTDLRHTYAISMPTFAGDLGPDMKPCRGMPGFAG